MGKYNYQSEIKKVIGKDSFELLESAVDISIVIPLYNEVECIQELYEQLVSALEPINRTFEVIFVDDGSTDGSFEKLKVIHKHDSRFKVIRLRRNFGKTSALEAGFNMAKGEWIVTMDADLQNDPADIPLLLAKAEEGYDVVSGWRRQRKDTLLTRKIPSRIANRLIAWVTGVYIHDYGCCLKIYHRDIIKNINLYGELHRFIPAVASGLGIKVSEVVVNHRPRKHGQSKFYSGFASNIKRTLEVLLDLLTVRFLLSYSTRPLHVFGNLGLLASSIGFVIALYLTSLKLIWNQSIGGRPLLVLAVLLIIVGVQFITIGLLGELVVRIYYETQNKPIYVVREVLDSESELEKTHI